MRDGAFEKCRKLLILVAGMSSKNLAICWAPNLLRSKLNGENLQHNLVQNTQIVQYLIDNAKWLFATEDEISKRLQPTSQPTSSSSKNQLPPQYLERVKFIEPEGQKQRPLSKRYLVVCVIYVGFLHLHVLEITVFLTSLRLVKL